MKFMLALGAAMVLAAPSTTGPDLTSLGVGYICSAEGLTGAATGGDPNAMLPGVGAERFPADTANPQAQAWFDQGVRLYHAFNHDEAKTAFARAAALDPACALCAWGVALSLGPTLNYGVSPEETAKALATADRAAALVKPGDARAAGLIASLQRRYRPGVEKHRSDKLYGRDLEALVRRFPQDDGIADLAAHALLIPARADDYSGVPRAEAILRGVLARRPDDVAAIHYYIHATEFAGHPALALPYAERLEGLAPGASHLVHMGAHTFMRVGRYEQVALVDARALEVDAKVMRLTGRSGPLGGQRYYQHNFLFGLAGALMAGDGTLALKYAEHAPRAFSAATPADRRTTVTSRSLVAYGRFAPAQALALPEAPDEPRIHAIYRRYARGEALAAQGDAAGVRREAEALEALRAQARAEKQTGSVQIAAIARDVLAGRAAMLSGRPREAARLYAAGARAQEKAFPVFDNFDPPPWWYPVRRSVAAAHLKAGRYRDAVREANASLADWPQDGLALRILAEAEARLGRRDAAREHQAQALRAWRGDPAAVSLDLT